MMRWLSWAPSLYLLGPLLVAARQPGFNIHDDVLAYPQFEITFVDSVVREKEVAQFLYQTRQPPVSGASTDTPDHASYTPTPALFAPTDPRSNPHPSPGSSEKHIYEVMKIHPSHYLCAIPYLDPNVAENKTEIELAKAQEEKELARASIHGWQLLEELNGDCLYYMSGWWSYRFCYNRDIVQFHALPSIPNGHPPVQDTNTAAYILGRVYKTDWTRAQKNPHVVSGLSEDEESARNPEAYGEPSRPPNSELQVKGDQRYLVQRLEGGTLCDLTGRERTIEIQYHCIPGLKKDRIGWIKEITTCSYLMVVNTPRLCADVVFLPPEATTANSIRCQLIVSDAHSSGAEALLGPNAHGDDHEADTASDGPLDSSLTGDAREESHAYGPLDQGNAPLIVGGVTVGAKKVLQSADGKPPVKLDLSRSSFSSFDSHDGGNGVHVVASGQRKADGGAVTVMTPEQLEKLNLSPEMVEKMKTELEEMAGDKGWRLEIANMPDDTWEIRGFVDIDDEDSEADPAARPDDAGREAGGEARFARGPEQGDATRGGDSRSDDEQGNEERFFKDEL